MSKLNNEQKMYKRKIKRPGIVYLLLGGIWKLLMFKKYHVKVTFKKDFRKEKGPYLLVSNHASRMDYIFMGVPVYPNRFNFVAGYNEFYRSHLQLVFKMLKVIPKKNFVPDVYTIKEMKRIVREKGKVVIFPEGMNSISGANQPVAIGTGKLIKHLNIPVYYSLIQGGYLTSPKYALDERRGKVDVTYDQLFTLDEIKELSVEEIEDKMNKALYNDDFEWNKIHKYKYNIKDKGAENLHHLLFYCPKCHRQFTMKGEGNKIYCLNCGNGANMDQTYTLTPFDETCVIPDTQTKWFNMQREVIKEEIKDPNFTFSAKVKLGMLPKYKYLKDLKTSEIVGEGEVIISHQGLTYKGTKDNEEFNFSIKSEDLPTYGMCTDMTRFYTFYKGEFVEFYPEEPVVEKIFLVTEEIHRLNGGRWQDFKKD